MAKKLREYAYANKDIAASKATPDGPRRSPVGAALGQAGADAEAAAWDFIICQADNYLIHQPASTFLPGMKAENAALELFVYTNTAFQGKAPGTAGAPDTAQFFKSCPADGGNYLRSGGYGTYLMHIDVAGGWRTNRVNDANARIAQDDNGPAGASLIDGVFMDLAGPAPVQGSYVVDNYPATPRHGYIPRSCPGGTPYTRNQWMGFTSATVEAVVDGITSGKQVIANGFEANSYDDTKQLWESGCDYAMFEGFLPPAGPTIDDFPSESAWLTNLKVLGPIIGGPHDSQSKACLPMMKLIRGGTTTKAEQWREYGFASMLLATDGDDRFSFFWLPATGWPDNMVAPAWYEKEIGEPLGTAAGDPITTAGGTGQKVDGVYQRQFTDGHVIVNPTASNAAAVDLPAGTWYDKNDVEVTSPVTVPPHTGLILFAADVPTGGGGGGGSSSGGGTTTPGGRGMRAGFLPAR